MTQKQKKNEQEQEKIGLECLDDKCLAAMVEASMFEHQALKGEAITAFNELARRSGE